MGHLSPEQLDALGARLLTSDDLRAPAARARLAGGDYGLCVRCGDELAWAWLDAAPARGFCEVCEHAQRDARARSRFGICGVKPG